MRNVLNPFVLLTVVALLVLSVAAVAYGEIWGSVKSKSYHLASCRYVKKTWKGYRIRFDSVADARTAGYKPCEVCKPPKGAAPGTPPTKPQPGS